MEMLKLVSPASLFHSLALKQRVKLEERWSMVFNLGGSQAPITHRGWLPAAGQHRRGTSTGVPMCWNINEKMAFSLKQLPHVRSVWCRYFLSSMFPCSWWTNVLVLISPLHEEQPTPQHRSGIWVGLPWNPIFCITMSNNGPYVQFYNVDLGI